MLFPARVALWCCFCGSLLFMELLLLLLLPVVATAFAAAFADLFAAFADSFGAFFLCCHCLVLFVLLFEQLASACAGCCLVLIFLLFVLSVVCAAFSVVVAAFWCFCNCFLGRRPLNPTLPAFDLPKCQELFFN